MIVEFIFIPGKLYRARSIGSSDCTFHTKKGFFIDLIENHPFVLYIGVRFDKGMGTYEHWFLDENGKEVALWFVNNDKKYFSKRFERIG